MIGTVDLEGASTNEKKAFYINAYNLLVIYQVVMSYPISKPMDQIGFFDQNKYLVAGELLTLNELEIDRMLKTFKDPRIHFVLACAALSCPQLANFAYKPDRVEQMLQVRTTMMLNNEDFIRVKKEQQTVEVSKIFEWYKNDFTKDYSSITRIINQYRKEKIPEHFTLAFYQYNWKLNERKA